MNVRFVLTLVILSAWGGGAALAQEVLYLDPNVPRVRGVGNQFFLSPTDTQIMSGNPAFLDANSRGIAPNGLFSQPQVGGNVVGNPVLEAGVLPGIFPAGLHVDIGFEYLRPSFPGRSVRLVVPSGVNGNFATLAGSGDVSYNFGFIPKMNATYQFSDLGLGVSASGELSTIGGHLTRSIDGSGGSANLTASSTINFANANLIEGTLSTTLGRFQHFEDTCLQDTVVLFTLGARYSHLSQDFTASLNSGDNGSTLTAHQDWDGFGLTSSLSYLHPLEHNFFLYGVARGSVLVGTNNRTSTLSVVVPANPAGSTATKLTDDHTNIVPVGEFEVGVAWGKPLAPQSAEATRAAEVTGPLLWIKAGLVADIWGQLGVLSAPDNNQGFSDSRLLLYGFSVQVGIHY
jgi:hypothetical protein